MVLLFYLKPSLHSTHFLFFFSFSLFSLSLFILSHVELSEMQRIFPHAFNSEDAHHPLFFSPAKYLLSPKCQKVPLLSYPLTFYTLTPLSIWASWVPSPSAPKSPPSAWEPHPPLFLLHSWGQLTPFSFQLASPPRIYMDSWWAARNPNQGLKWTQNIAQNWSGAYGSKPYRIWAPKLPKSVFYTSWLDEPDANRSNWLQKILKIW